MLIFTSLRGMIYNSKLIPKDKAPKSYEDLVDPKLSPTWAGKLAIPPYVSWLVELSMIWSEDKVKNFTRKLVALERRAAALQRRGARRQRRISHRRQHGRRDGTDVAVAGQGRAAARRHGFDAGAAVLFPTGGAEKFRAPESRETLRRLHGVEGSPGDSGKKDFRTSHLVEGTMMANYLKQNRVQLQEAKDSIGFYLQGEDSGLAFKEELTKMLKQ